MIRWIIESSLKFQVIDSGFGISEEKVEEIRDSLRF